MGPQIPCYWNCGNDSRMSTTILTFRVYQPVRDGFLRLTSSATPADLLDWTWLGYFRTRETTSNLTGQQNIKRDDKYYHNSYASAAWGIYLKPRTDWGYSPRLIGRWLHSDGETLQITDGVHNIVGWVGWVCLIPAKFQQYAKLNILLLVRNLLWVNFRFYNLGFVTTSLVLIQDVAQMPITVHRWHEGFQCQDVKSSLIAYDISFKDSFKTVRNSDAYGFLTLPSSYSDLNRFVWYKDSVHFTTHWAWFRFLTRIQSVHLSFSFSLI